ncbi:major facilitator superfamily domain-containing protein [Aspergillus karnatakaensis]|uniref:major facilitator superfamily domain-containing protein n=1 Tax=Aspergillus karnatakaensis TaxID=1810916 RepID=UPI003CCDCC5C
MTLMPIIFVLYLFNYLDRNNIAQAELDSFSEDLNLTGNDYSVAVSILNVGYVLMQLPSNMLLTKLRPSLYIPFWVCIWSCVSATTAATKNFGSLIAVRLILGVCEAPFFPAVFYLLSCWYTKKELALRYAILYSGLVLATATSGLLAAAIFAGLDEAAGLAGWQWLFIIEGAASLLLGLIAFGLLPDLPGQNTGSARWLFTPEEQQLAVDRMRRDAVSAQEDNTSVRHGLKLAVLDIKVWGFALIMCCSQSAYGFNYFYPKIVEGFDLGSRKITLACTAPPYIIGAVISYFIAWSSDRRKERGFHITTPIIVAMIGFIISVATLNIPARYFASFVYISGIFGANAVVFSWAATTVSNTAQKKACAMAIVNITGQLGSIWSPYFFHAHEAPRYLTAMILLLVFSALEAVICVGMRFLLRRENKRLIAWGNEEGVVPNLYTL